MRGSSKVISDKQPQSPAKSVSSSSSGDDITHAIELKYIPKSDAVQFELLGASQRSPYLLKAESRVNTDFTNLYGTSSGRDPIDAIEAIAAGNARPKFVEESLSHTTLDEIVGSRSSSVQFGESFRFGANPYMSTLPTETYEKSSRRRKATRNNSLSEECLQIVKKYKKPSSAAAAAIAAANAAAAAAAAAAVVEEEEAEPAATTAAAPAVDDSGKKKLRSNPREWKVLQNDLSKDECIDFLKYHRWKEPVTNAPKGTGCRVSQCAIHSGCPHLLKMRLTQPTDVTRYTIEECFEHQGEVSNHNQGLHDFILEDVDYLLFAGLSPADVLNELRRKYSKDSNKVLISLLPEEPSKIRHRKLTLMKNNTTKPEKFNHTPELTKKDDEEDAAAMAEGADAGDAAVVELEDGEGVASEAADKAEEVIVTLTGETAEAMDVVGEADAVDDAAVSAR